jgi:hypothetical protein
VKQFRTLLWWRLRHYSSVTYQLLRRRWQMTVFVLLVASPALMPLLMQIDLLGTPIVALTEPGHFRLSASIWIVAGIGAIAWSAVQANAVGGGPAWLYIRSLPLSPLVPRAVDLAVLAAIDLPLFVPCIAAVISLLRHGGWQAVPRSIAVLALCLQWPVLQWLGLNRPVRTFQVGLIGLAALGAVAWGASPLWLALGTAAGGFWALRLPLVQTHGAARLGTAIERLLERLLTPRRGRRAAWNLALIDGRFLLSASDLNRHMSLLLSVSAPLALFAAMRYFGAQPLALTLVPILALPLVVLRVAGFELELRQMHRPVLPLLHSLGVDEATQRRIDSIVLQGVFVPAACPLALLLYDSTDSWHAWALLPVGTLALAACIRLNRWRANAALLPQLAVTAVACGGLVKLVTV